MKDKNGDLINTINTTNKTTKNKTNIQSKKLIYPVNHSFAKLRNIDDVKKLSLDSMFSIMKEDHKKFNSLNKLELIFSHFIPVILNIMSQHNTGALKS